MQRALYSVPHSALMAGICLVILIGCRQEMADQPRYEPYEASRLFPDSMAVRHPVRGTVSRESALDDVYRPEYARDAAGLAGDGASAASGDTTTQSGPNASAVAADYPYPVTEAILRRGRNRFDIYCSPCHGRAGYGTGIIVQRGLQRPPSLHTDRLRSAPPSHFYDAMTNGFGAMYSYASRVSPADRWAIAAYIQALQLSQHAGLDAVPADTLAHMEMP